MLLQPPISTRNDTLFPYSKLFRACGERSGTVRISVCGRAVEHYAAMALMKRSPNRTANWALAMDALPARNARSGSGRSAADCHSAHLPLRTNRVVPHETYARQARAAPGRGRGGRAGGSEEPTSEPQSLIRPT